MDKYPHRYQMEKIMEIIEDIKKEEGIFIVEGKKDKKVLIDMGICKKRILEISHLPLYALKDILSPFSRINDFLDEDKEGERIRKRIKQLGIVLNHTHRRRLFTLLKISHMEEATYIFKKLM